MSVDIEHPAKSDSKNRKKRDRDSDRKGAIDGFRDLRESMLRGRRRMLAEVFDVLADVADSDDDSDDASDSRRATRDRLSDGLSDLADSVDRASSSLRRRRN